MFDYIQYFHKKERFTYPNWELIQEAFPTNLSEQEEDKCWNLILTDWANILSRELGENYKIHDTKNFKIITNQNNDFIENYSQFLEHCLTLILSKLKHIAYKYENEPLLVLIIENNDDYYNYISNFYGEGEFGLSGGLFYKKGMGHFIFPHVDQFSSEMVSAHELTHALLNHLDLPIWLDEGIATNMEDSITTANPVDTSKEIREKHALFWNEERIQEFWSGQCFSRSDEGQELSYNLAQFLVKHLARSYNAFANFCNSAQYEDGGEKAMQECFGVPLADLITPLLGDGNWAPQPERWDRELT